MSLVGAGEGKVATVGGELILTGLGLVTYSPVQGRHFSQRRGGPLA